MKEIQQPIQQSSAFKTKTKIKVLINRNLGAKIKHYGFRKLSFIGKSYY